MVISGVRQKYYQNNVTAAKKLYGVGNLEKRAQTKKQQQEMLNEKIAKMEQERSRLSRSWSSDRQMAKASNAYDANVVTETVTAGDLLLG